MRIGKNTISHNFYVSAKKYLEDFTNSIVTDIENEAKDQLNGWRKDVKSALGKQIPSWENFNGRTKDRSRLFPYRRTGALQQRPVTDVEVHRQEQNTRIFLSGHITGKVSDLTNSKGDGAWTGWKEDVLFKHGRGNIPSLRDIFSSIIKYRKGKI